MQLMMVRVNVPYPQNIALIRLQARESHLLKVIHDAPLLFGRHLVIRVPGKSPGGEFPYGVQRVYEFAGNFHIAAQHFRRQFVTALVIGTHKIICGAVAAALAVGENFHVHELSSESGLSAGGAVSINFCSRLTRAMSTSMVSARFL